MLRPYTNFEEKELKSPELVTVRVHSKRSKYSLLRYPDFSLPFVPYIEACDICIGAVLAQNGSDGKRIIAYASKSLQPNYQNYAVKYIRHLSIWPNIHCDD